MKEKILITVKTYPTLSKKYAELVCTAGVNENGEWIRIFPVPFRQIHDEQKYKKYQWIEAELKKSPSDNRPESYQIVDLDSLVMIGEPLPTDKKWDLRRQQFIERVEIHKNLTETIDSAHRNELSLVLFRPTKWLRFTVKEVGREWDSDKIALLESQKKQLDLFKDEQTVAEEFKIVSKLPYKFSYEFEDATGKATTMMIEDWEIGALYWNCLRACKGDEEQALAKVQTKYWDNFVKKPGMDTLLILGTTLQFHHKKVPNPFVIIGVVPLPEYNQPRLF